MVLYLLLRPGDDPGAEQELTEEMQTPRVPRADRAAPAPSDSGAQAEAGNAETAGGNETDVQDAAARAQSGNDEKPALTPLQQERYDFFAKAGPILLELQLENSRLQYEEDYATKVLNERWAYDGAHPDYEKFKAEEAIARKKLREAQAAISRMFAPEVVFDSNQNLEYYKVEELVGGTLPPEYLEARQSVHDREREISKKFHVPTHLRGGILRPQGWRPFIDFTASELEELGIDLEKLGNLEELGVKPE